jgi:hypothetical protein
MLRTVSRLRAAQMTQKPETLVGFPDHARIFLTAITICRRVTTVSAREQALLALGER